MARDKLITVRIEDAKREAFKQWAEEKNTDTSSLLYDFIDACLDNRLDISLLKRETAKTNQLDKRLADIEQLLADVVLPQIANSGKQ